MNRWALIDLGWLAHRARVCVGGLSHNDARTGTIFGFFEQLRTVAFDKKVATNQIILCRDSKKSLRKKAYPQYKERREDRRTDEEKREIAIMHEQIDILCEEWLPAIGFPIFRQTGLESDDIMAQIVQQYAFGKKFVMITGDHDLFQCITDNAHWYDPSREVYHDPGSILRKYFIDPIDFATVKALSGCKSDNVAGIPGIGEKSALDFITKILPSNTRRHKIVSKEGAAIHRRNWPLVKLPHNRTNPITLPEKIEYDEGAFLKMCKHFGLSTIIKGERWEAWQEFFKGGKWADRVEKPNRQVARKIK